MMFNEYQQRARETAVYPLLNFNLVYPAMGLSGEAGEVCEKVKKYWRRTKYLDPRHMTLDEGSLIAHELGDVLWYVAAMCSELRINMDEVAQRNLEKLHNRAVNKTLKGEGDER